MCRICIQMHVDAEMDAAVAAHGPLVAVASVYQDGAVEVTVPACVPTDFIQGALKMASKDRHWKRREAGH